MEEEMRYSAECITYEIERVFKFRKKRKYFIRWRNRILFCTLIACTISGLFLAVSIFLKDYRIALIGYLVARYFYDITKIIVFHREKDKLILIAFTNYDYKICRAAIEQMEDATTKNEIMSSLAVIKAIFQDTELYYKRIKKNVNAITKILEESNINCANNQFVL